MLLSREVGLSPSYIVLDGDPAPPAKGASQPPPLFGPCLLWPRSPISATAELLFCMFAILSLFALAATLLLCPREWWRNIVVSTSVCLSVCLSARISPESHL